MNNEEQQVIALAATVQALTVVHAIATKGHFDADDARAALQALVHYSPSDTLEAYGGDTADLRTGLNQLKHMFSDNLDRDIAQYLLTVVAVELTLVRNTVMRTALRQGLQEITNELHNEATDSDNEDDDSVESTSLTDVLVQSSTISSYATLYKQTASRVEPRVMIKGDHQHLQNEESANQIRALLLAALRGVAFFRHYGGKRIDFMMKRKQFLQIAEKLTRSSA